MQVINKEAKQASKTEAIHVSIYVGSNFNDVVNDVCITCMYVLLMYA